MQDWLLSKENLALSKRLCASLPSLPGCSSTGATEEQARERLTDAILGYLASVGDFIPDKLDNVLVYQRQA